jgi:hypothetical protein
MNDPSKNIINRESDHLFLCYCSFVNHIKGKKLSIQNVFVTTLQEEKLKTILKTILSLDSDQELVKMFLEQDQSICKSKYVTKWTRNAKYIHGDKRKTSKKGVDI